MNTVSAGEARKNLSDLINQAAYTGESTIIERHGKPVAALVSIEDLEAMEALEDYLDVQEAEKRLADGEFVSFEEAERMLDAKEE